MECEVCHVKVYSSRKKRFCSDAHQYAAWVTSTKIRNKYAELVAWIDNLKRQPCKDCGGSFHPDCMDFHHVNGAKLYTISSMPQTFMTREHIEREMAKCVLVCANCKCLRKKQKKAVAV